MFKNLQIDCDWIDVPGYEGIYKANKDGRVMSVGKSIKTKSGHIQSWPSTILKPYQGIVTLRKDNKGKDLKVANIIAATFIDGCTIQDSIGLKTPGDYSLDNLIVTINTEETAEWKFIPGYEGYYQASVYGGIRSVDRFIEFETSHLDKMRRFQKGRELLFEKGKDGYYRFVASVDGVTKLLAVHRAVASTFIPNPEHKPQVNHIDGNKENNSVSNLEWVTRIENMDHAKDLGLWNPKRCGDISRMQSGISVICIDDNIKFDSISQAAKYYNLDFESVKFSLRTGKTTKGKLFKYLGDIDGCS